MDTNQKIINWVFNSNTGTSSLTMAAITLGQTSIKYGFDRPYDSGDFSRCYDLVKLVPEVKLHFDKIKQLCPQFSPIIDRWDELCALYESDEANGSRDCGDLLRKVSDDCYIAGGWLKTRYGWTKNPNDPNII